MLLKKIPNLKLVIESEYQNKKTFLLKDILKIVQKKFLLLVKVFKNTVPWIYVKIDLNGKPITGTFYEEELQKTNQKEFRIDN